MKNRALTDDMAQTACSSVGVRMEPCVIQHLADVTAQMAGRDRCVTSVCNFIKQAQFLKVLLNQYGGIGNSTDKKDTGYEINQVA